MRGLKSVVFSHNFTFPPLVENNMFLKRDVFLPTILTVPDQVTFH